MPHLPSIAAFRQAARQYQLVPVYLIAVEKAEPFRCGVWRVSDQTLAVARQENEAAIRRLRRAWEIDAFPTGYEVIRILDFP